MTLIGSPSSRVQVMDGDGVPLAWQLKVTLDPTSNSTHSSPSLIVGGSGNDIKGTRKQLSKKNVNSGITMFLCFILC